MSAESLTSVREFEHRGWHFTARAGAIADQPALEAMSLAVGFHQLPEMVFASNVFEIQSDSLGLRFCAQEALKVFIQFRA